KVPVAPAPPPAKPTPPVASTKVPAVAPLPARAKPVQALPKPTPMQAEDGEAAGASPPAKYVQIGDITPVNEEQRLADMDDIMNAVMTLEKEASFSSGKEKPNLKVYDKEGRPVDTDGLLGKDKATAPAPPEAAGAGAEALVEKILAVYEKQEIVNGGVMQLAKLKALLDEEAGYLVDGAAFASTIDLVQSMGMIFKVMDIPGGEKLVLFKEIELATDEIRIIHLALSAPIAEFTKDNLVKRLGAPEEKVLGTLKKLQEKGIIRFAGNSIEIPGVIQKK
ncbi:MAG: hypothetical protein JW839_00735, partial [Candidatus Lokiarchaeota archaeon]|nr:hypothetical protein [Candidatus Lokiarchaeota archaeon]